MARPPLLVRSVIIGRRYISALIVIAVGFVPFAFMVLEIARPGPVIIVVAIALIAYGPLLAANTYLGYPRLQLSGDRLTIESSPFGSKSHDLGGLGHAYMTVYRTKRTSRAALIFRDKAGESAHRAAEKFPHEPAREEAAMEIPVDAFVGSNVEKGEALAGEINRYRAL